MSAKIPESIIRQALELQDQCWPHAAIAKQLGVSYNSLTFRLAQINKAAAKKLESERAERKLRQVRQLERIAHEALRGWERSQEDAKTLKKIKVGPEPGKGKKPLEPEERTEITVKGQSGNPAFLAEARAALEGVRKILGLDHAVSPGLMDASDKPPRLTIPSVDVRPIAEDES